MNTATKKGRPAKQKYLNDATATKLLEVSNNLEEIFLQVCNEIGITASKTKRLQIISRNLKCLASEE